MTCTYTLKNNKTNELLTFNSEKDLDLYLSLHYDEFKNISGESFRFSKNYSNKLDSDLVTANARLAKDRENSRLKKINDKFTLYGSVSTDLVESNDDYKDGFKSILNFISESNFIQTFNLDDYKSNTLINNINNKPNDVSEEQFKIAIYKSIEDTEIPFWQYLQETGRGFHKVFDKIMNSRYPITVDMVRSDIKKKLDQSYTNSKNIVHLDNVSDKAIQDFIDQITNIKKSITLNNTRGKKLNKLYTEYVLDREGNPKLRGKVDLLAIYEDNDGNQSVEIYDLKLSTTPIDKWDEDKKNAINYQLGFYKRILQEKGINAKDIALKIIPVYINESNKDSKSISNLIVGDSRTIIPTISQQTNIDNTIPIEIGKETLDNELINTVNNIQSKLFPVSKINPSSVVDFDIAYQSQVTKTNGKYYFKDETKSSNESPYIIKDTEEEIKEALEDYLTRKQEYDSNITNSITKELKTSLDVINSNKFNPARNDFNVLPLGNGNIDKQEFLKVGLSKYRVEQGWDVIENESLSALNVIMLVNQNRKEFDLISLSNYNVDNTINFGKGDTLLGRFKTNNQVELDHNIMKGTIANTELIKLMSIANAFSDTDLSNYTIGNLQVININSRQRIDSMLISDKLEYNYNMLLKNAEINSRNKMKFTDSFESVFRTLNGIQQNSPKEFARKVENFTLCPDGEIDSLEKFEKRNYLNDLFKKLQTNYFNNSSNLDLTNPITYLYYETATALNIYGETVIDINNNDIWSENFGNAWKNLKNRTFGNGTNLNTIDTTPIIRPIAIKIAATNQNITNHYNTYKNKDRVVTNKFYDNVGQSLFGKKILNNATIIFQNLLDKSEEGKLTFSVKDYTDMSNDLTTPEREYLKYFCEQINSITNKGKTKEQVGKKWLEVPLLRASSYSKIVNGKNVFVTQKEDAGLELVNPRMTTNEQERHISEDSLKNISEMYNLFDISVKSVGGRESLIKAANGNPYKEYETNLEQVKDMFMFSYYRKEEMDKILPSINAALVSLQLATQVLSHKDATSTINAINEYIKSAIFDESLIKLEDRGTYRIAGALKSMTSKVILGFNFMSGTKETITGFFNLYTKAAINSMTDKDMFTLSDLDYAYKKIWVDSINQTNTITLMEHLNWQYRLANMDMSELVDKMNYDKTDRFRFNSHMYWANRAPDFLGRMTILVAYMKKHGCLDAHKLENDEIVYDWKKDKRFDVLTNPNADKHSDVYKFQKALYNNMMDDFIEENYQVYSSFDGSGRQLSSEKDADGKYKEDLPQAYTTKDVEAIKQQSNTMFGYMDKDTKSAYLKKGIFTLIGQFQTYMSAKKNQWFLARGTHSQGKRVHVEVDGKKQYWKNIENTDGSIDRIMSDEVTDEPVVDWQGKIMEGIAWSLVDLLNFTKPENMKLAWKDPLKLQNLYLGLRDLAIIGIISLFLKLFFGSQADLKKAPAFNQAVGRILYNVGGEFNAVQTFTGAFDLQVPTYTFLQQVGTDGLGVLLGNKNVAALAANNIGALRPFKPVIYQAINDNQ